MKKAVILAAGPGAKLWPYNEVRNKCALPIGNVPLVRRLADDLAALGVNQIAVVVGARGASVRHALRGAAGVGVVASAAAGSPAGTAADALAGLGALDHDEPIWVVYGDTLIARRNLAALAAAHEQGDALATVLVAPLGDDPPGDHILAHVEDGRLIGIEGHGREGQWRLAGAAILSPAATPYLRDNPGLVTRVPVGGMPPMEADLAQSLQMMVEEGETVAVVQATAGYCLDIDRPWQILAADAALRSHLVAELTASVIAPSARIHDGAEVLAPVVLGEGAEIGNRVRVDAPLWLAPGASVTNGAIILHPTIVGSETRVRDYCMVGGATMGPRGIIGHGAEFSGVALDTVYLYHYCEIWGVLGSAVDIGAATVCGTLRFDDGVASQRVAGRTEHPRSDYANATFFGDYCRTGVNVIPMPGAKIGAYSCVGAGVVVYEDVPSRKLVLQKQELATRDWGPERYGW